MTDFLVDTYFNNTILPAKPRQATGWKPSLDRILSTYRPGDELVKSSYQVSYSWESWTHDVPVERIMVAACDRAFALLNADDRPNGHSERSMCMGDVARVSTGEHTAWFSCEDIGWKSIPEPQEEAITDETVASLEPALPPRT
jgi:hypothetical protein